MKSPKLDWYFSSVFDLRTRQIKISNSDKTRLGTIEVVYHAFIELDTEKSEW